MITWLGQVWGRMEQYGTGLGRTARKGQRGTGRARIRQGWKRTAWGSDRLRHSWPSSLTYILAHSSLMKGTPSFPTVTTNSSALPSSPLPLPHANQSQSRRSIPGRCQAGRGQARDPRRCPLGPHVTSEVWCHWALACVSVSACQRVSVSACGVCQRHSSRGPARGVRTLWQALTDGAWSGQVPEEQKVIS